MITIMNNYAKNQGVVVISKSFSQFSLMTTDFREMGFTSSGCLCRPKNCPGSHVPFLLASYKMRSSYSPGKKSGCEKVSPVNGNEFTTEFDCTNCSTGFLER